MKMKIKGIILLFSCFFIAIVGCDRNQTELITPACDDSTVPVSFKNDLTPILVVNCFNCHSAENNSIVGGNINLQDYKIDSTYIGLSGDGQLIDALLHKDSINTPPMPRDGGMLSDCSIKKFIYWGKQGALNN